MKPLLEPLEAGDVVDQLHALRERLVREFEQATEEERPMAKAHLRNFLKAIDVACECLLRHGESSQG